MGHKIDMCCKIILLSLCIILFFAKLHNSVAKGTYNRSRTNTNIPKSTVIPQKPKPNKANNSTKQKKQRKKQGTTSRQNRKPKKNHRHFHKDQLKGRKPQKQHYTTNPNRGSPPFALTEHTRYRAEDEGSKWDKNTPIPIDREDPIHIEREQMLEKLNIIQKKVIQEQKKIHYWMMANFFTTILLLCGFIGFYFMFRSKFHTLKQDINEDLEDMKKDMNKQIMKEINRIIKDHIPPRYTIPTQDLSIYLPILENMIRKIFAELDTFSKIEKTSSPTYNPEPELLPVFLSPPQNLEGWANLVFEYLSRDNKSSLDQLQDHFIKTYNLSASLEWEIDKRFIRVGNKSSTFPVAVIPVPAIRYEPSTDEKYFQLAPNTSPGTLISKMVRPCFLSTSEITKGVVQ